MQSLSRSMVSGGPGVRRIPRWHPYHPPAVATPSSGSSTSSEATTHHAPLFLSKRCTVSSAVYAPSPLSLLAVSGSTPLISDADHTAEVQAPPSKILTAEDRATYARCLVDRAVSILTQKWMPVAYCPFPQVLAFPKETKVTTPLGPTSPSPFNTAFTTPLEPATPRYPYQSTAEHMPLRQFLHEVLRRSRTSCTSLQTAICYVEAVATKLPDLVQDEMRRIDQQNVSSILEDGAVADSAETLYDGADAPGSLGAPGSFGDDADAAQPSLPSPLLCPRRTFLASLLLASKFLQDRSYSNKAWGKLTGLAPREVGRCERALSEALEWRLWVGKGQASVFPPDFMDDGGPVIPPDAVYAPEPDTPQSSAPAVPHSIAGGSALTSSSRLRKTRSESLVVLPRATARRLGPAATWAPCRFASSMGSGPMLTSTSRTATWVHDLPSALPPLPAGTATPLAEPQLHFLPNEATFVDAGSTPSLSPPGSLVYTQSSAASFASFPELATPPDAFAHTDVGFSALAKQSIMVDKTNNAAFRSVESALEDIAGAGDWTY